MKSLMLLVICGLVGTTTSFEVFQVASLKAHNAFRRRHKNTPDMHLDKDLNTRAQTCAQYYAQKGSIDHSCPQKNGAGENLYMSSGGKIDGKLTAIKAAKSFYEEMKSYNFNKPGFSSSSGHFTQLVWAGSMKLGAGYAKNGDKQYFVNLYNQHGNVEGQYPQNVFRVKKA